MQARSALAAPESVHRPASGRIVSGTCARFGWASSGLRLGRLAAVLACAAMAQPAAANPFDAAVLRDTRASFIDVASRTRLLQTSKGDALLAASLPKVSDCANAEPVLPPEGPMVIPPRYASGNHGPVNPAYETTVKLYRDFENTAASLGNLYVATGEAGYAACLLTHLGRWADANALTGYTVSTAPGVSNQPWYQAEWSASAAALALSQVVREPSLEPAAVDRVIAWLHRVSLKQTSYPGGENTCCNNHAYWRGLHATMVGVLANDQELFRWGLGRYALAIDQIAEDGSLPLEVARHEQALHYQNYALLPLMVIAEIAAQQGIDLYGYKANDRDLHAAVGYLERTLPAARDSERVDGKAKLDLRAFAPGRGDQAWAEIYRARFGRDPLGLLSRPVFNARTGGGATLLWYTPATAAEARLAPSSARAAPRERNMALAKTQAHADSSH